MTQPKSNHFVQNKYTLQLLNVKSTNCYNKMNAPYSRRSGARNLVGISSDKYFTKKIRIVLEKEGILLYLQKKLNKAILGICKVFLVAVILQIALYVQKITVGPVDM